MPTCYIIAGPNGAGKTTFALHFLSKVVNCHRFINADMIAAGLAPLAPELELATAGRLFLKEVKRAIHAREDFAFETTLAGRGHVARVKELRRSGWKVHLIYLALPSVAASRKRVAERVAHGGHDIPEADIIRRFPRSLWNLFEVYLSEVDIVTCYVNMGDKPSEVFSFNEGETVIRDQECFDSLRKESRHGRS